VNLGSTSYGCTSMAMLLRSVQNLRFNNNNIMARNKRDSKNVCLRVTDFSFACNVYSKIRVGEHWWNTDGSDIYIYSDITICRASIFNLYLLVYYPVLPNARHHSTHMHTQILFQNIYLRVNDKIIIIFIVNQFVPIRLILIVF